MTQRTATDRANKYAAKQRAAGLQKVAVWVPVDKVKQLKQHAERLRGKHTGKK
jgi:hypothetical protein